MISSALLEVLLAAGSPVLLRMAEEVRPLIVLDPLRNAHDAKENDSDEMSRVMKSLRALQATGAAVGHYGTFQVIGVHAEKLTVDLNLIGPSDCYEREIPWIVLLFLDSGSQPLQMG